MNFKFYFIFYIKYKDFKIKIKFNFIEINLQDNIYNETRSCRICDLCYKLLITEQEIYEVQRAIALCNNIDVEGEDDSECIKVSKKNENKLLKYKHKFETINQWRIMFYFIRFYVN